MKIDCLLLLPLTLLGVVSTARAADAPQPIQVATPAEPAAPLPPRINLDTPAVGPAVHRTYHMHEGFYLRASLGFGDYHASFSDGNHSNQDFTEQGNSMALDLLIGGSPSPGVSVGGALFLDPLFGADYERNGYGAGSHGGFSTLVGPFLDGFPDPTKGWHLGAMMGLAAQSFQDVNMTTGKTTTAGGLGGAAWFGYDFWVAGEWAVGPQLRLMGMRTSDTRSGEDVSAWARSFTLGVSAVFN
jgi:hypothetical protein